MKKIVVLVVEDNSFMSDSIADSIQYFFAERDIEVEVVKATSLEEAIDCLTDDRHDLITLDGNLSHGHHGSDVLKKMSLKQVSKTIIYSGEMGFVSDCHKNGIPAFLKSESFLDILPSIENRIINQKNK